MSTEEEILQRCQDYINCSGYDCDSYADFEYSKQECRTLLNGKNQGQGLNITGGSLGVFSSWWTLVFIAFALLFPLVVVAIYTGFSFQWKKREDIK